MWQNWPPSIKFSKGVGERRHIDGDGERNGEVTPPSPRQNYHSSPSPQVHLAEELTICLLRAQGWKPCLPGTGEQLSLGLSLLSQASLLEKWKASQQLKKGILSWQHRKASKWWQGSFVLVSVSGRFLTANLVWKKKKKRERPGYRADECKMRMSFLLQTPLPYLFWVTTEDLKYLP